MDSKVVNSLGRVINEKRTQYVHLVNIDIFIAFVERKDEVWDVKSVNILQGVITGDHSKSDYYNKELLDQSKLNEIKNNHKDVKIMIKDDVMTCIKDKPYIMLKFEAFNNETKNSKLTNIYHNTKF